METAEPNPWRRTSRRVAYRNDWIEVYHDEVVAADGQPTSYGVVHSRPAAVSILASREGEVLLVGQHRYPIDAYSWEIPGGAAAPGEDLLAAAQRELAEETGYRAARWRELTSFTLWNSTSDARCLVFAASVLTQGTPAPDSTERLSVRWVGLQDAAAMGRNGEIHDAISLIAIMRLFLDREDLAAAGSSPPPLDLPQGS